CDYGRLLEAKALNALDRWLAERRSPEHLRLALTLLSEHEAQNPPVYLSIQAEHVHMRNLLDIGALSQNQAQLHEFSTEAELVPLSWFAPWERQRQTRILNGLTEAGLRVAALDPQTAAALLDSWSPNANDRQRGWLHSCGLPLLDPADARTTTARWLPLLV